MGNSENNVVEDANLETSLDNASPDDVPNVNEHHDLYPRIGLEFDSLDDVKKFYKAFAKKEGFGFRIRSSKPNSCILVCSNEGQHVSKSNDAEESNATMKKVRKRCSTSRTDCKASLVVSKARKRHNWAIISFNNDHNHIMVSPKSVKYLRCHKEGMSVAAKNLVEKFHQEGLPTGKVATMFNNGSSSFSKRDCWNHLRNVRSRKLEVGDANKNVGFVGGETNLVSERDDSATLRGMHVHRLLMSLADLAAKSEKIDKFISSQLEEIYKKASMMVSEMQSSKDILLSETSCQGFIMDEQVNEEPELNIKDPIMSQTGRTKSSLELSMNRPSVNKDHAKYVENMDTIDEVASKS